MSTPLVFRGIRKLLGIGPPDKVLAVDGNGWESPAGDQPVDVGPRHACDGGSGADADILVRVDLLRHAPIVADRIQQAMRTTLPFRCTVYRNLRSNVQEFRRDQPANLLCQLSGFA